MAAWVSVMARRSLFRHLGYFARDIDFLFACINCIHTLPYEKGWNRRYKDQGLTVIDIHTPEYPFERDTAT